MTDITVLKRDLSGEVTWQYEGRVLERETNCVVLEALFNRDDTPFMGVITFSRSMTVMTESSRAGIVMSVIRLCWRRTRFLTLIWLWTYGWRQMARR